MSERLSQKVNVQANFAAADECGVKNNVIYGRAATRPMRIVSGSKAGFVLLILPPDPEHICIASHCPHGAHAAVQATVGHFLARFRGATAMYVASNFSERCESISEHKMVVDLLRECSRTLMRAMNVARGLGWMLTRSGQTPEIELLWTGTLFSSFLER